MGSQAVTLIAGPTASGKSDLAVKLALTQPESVHIQGLLMYMLELAKFDLNFDIRDRARFVRCMLAGSHEALRAKATQVLLASKPPPAVGRTVGDRLVNWSVDSQVAAAHLFVVD